MIRLPLKPWAIALIAAAVHLPSAGADTPPVATVPDENGSILLCTRGIARTAMDNNNKGMEAEVLHRHEFPYGAAPGWKWVYQGFSDGTNDTIVIKAAGTWIQQTPGGPITKLPLTFNGGAKTATIAKMGLQESDPITTEIKPGAVVWATIWYCPGDKNSGLPFQTVMCTRESKPGAEDYDGTAVGPVGTLEDLTLKGGFQHNGPALTAGQPFCARGYQPMCAVGKASADYHGPQIVPLFLGDSINMQALDFSDDKTMFAMRGFNGRFCAAKYPYMVYGQAGSNSVVFTSQLKSPVMVFILGDNETHVRKVTHIFDEFGVNTIRLHDHAAEIAIIEWLDRQEGAAYAQIYGIPFIQSTITPCVAALTKWTTQSDADKKAFATFVAQRQAFNNRVRTQSDDAHLPGCIGFWDPCTAVETDWKNGSNEWAAAYRADGIHPNSPGHQAIAETIPAKLMEDHPNPVPSQ